MSAAVSNGMNKPGAGEQPHPPQSPEPSASHPTAHPSHAPEYPVPPGTEAAGHASAGHPHPTAHTPQEPNRRRTGRPKPEPYPPSPNQGHAQSPSNQQHPDAPP